MPEFSTKQREKLSEENEAMPDGSYPIRNRADLKRAIQAFGRSKNPDKTKAWIKRRARELDAEDLIPESWLEHFDDSDYLIHYGVLGMKWGMHRAAKKGTSYSYKSHKTKKLEKKAAVAKAKGKKNAAYLADKAKASKKSDSNRQAYAKKTSVGKAIAQQYLFGPVGAGAYQKMRANKVDRWEAAIKTIAANTLVGDIGTYAYGSHSTTKTVKKKNSKNK